MNESGLFTACNINLQIFIVFGNTLSAKENL